MAKRDNLRYFLLLTGAALLGGFMGRRERKAIEGYSAFEPQTTCQPNPKPGVVRFRDYVLKRFGGGDLGISRECDAGISQHAEGRAWDWGIKKGASMPDTPYKDPALVDEFLHWLLANNHTNARRAGIMYLIYNRRIWKAYPSEGKGSGVWHDYGGRDPHDRHIHVSFNWAGARGETSLFDLIS